MFIAQRHLMESRKDGPPVAYAPGEAIPGFATWATTVRRALLGHEMVREVAAAEDLAVAIAIPDDRPPDPDEAAITCSHCPGLTFKSTKALGAHKRYRH